MDPTLDINDLPSQTVQHEETVEESFDAPHTSTVQMPSAFDEANREADVNATQETVDPTHSELHTADKLPERSSPPLAEAPVTPAGSQLSTVGAAAATHDGDELDAAEKSAAALGDLIDDADENLLASLFGVNFEIDEDVLARDAIDPHLVDTRDIFTSLFGAAAETDVMLNEGNREQLEALMDTNRKESARDEVYELFGDAVNGLELERTAPFSVLHMEPPAPTPVAPRTRSWLVNMPTMYPNRQILHADPQPYFPSACPYLESNARMLFTPHNVMRWSYHAGSRLFLSNSRMVRWSDGSVTLHVGSDRHHIQDAKSNEALELLCKTSMVRKGEMEVPALVASVFPRRRCVIESNEASSIKQAVMHENMVSKEMSSQLTLPYASTPLPKVDWNRPSKTRGPIEEYVATEYARRMKEIQARAKEGKRMTLVEQLEMESKLLQELRHTSVEELKEMQEEMRRQEALRTVQNGQKLTRGKRSRLDRDLGLVDDGVPVRYNTVEGEEEDGDDDDAVDALEHDVDGDDYEAQYRRMYPQADQSAPASEEEQERQRKMARLEAEKNDKAAPLIAAMQALVATLPMGALTYGDIKGTLDYLESGNFSAELVKRELPAVLADLTQELPEVDVSPVRSLLETTL